MEALAKEAVSKILVHNHPSGDPTPSEADKSITMQIKNAGEMIGIHLLDHIIIGNYYFSIKEETSIHENTYFHQLYTFGNADRDPRTRIITTVYLSMTPETNIRKTFANDDATDAAWFTIRKCVQEQNDRERVSVLTLQYLDTQMEYRITDTVKNNYIETRSQLMEESTTELAGDHVKAINMAMDQVMNRAASTGILFNLLEEEFTLREVQNVYEAIITRKTDTGNFRRDIKRMLKETGTYRNVKGKKVKLYRFDPMYRYLEENL
jgi:hypothetical protein